MRCHENSSFPVHSVHYIFIPQYTDSWANRFYETHCLLPSSHFVQFSMLMMHRTGWPPVAFRTSPNLKIITIKPLISHSQISIDIIKTTSAISTINVFLMLILQRIFKFFFVRQRICPSHFIFFWGGRGGSQVNMSQLCLLSDPTMFKWLS